MLTIFFFILIFSILISSQKSNSLMNNTYTNNFLLFTVIIVFGIEIYYIDSNLIPDYQTYSRWYNISKYLSFSQLNLLESKDTLFFFFLWVFSKISSNFNLFILVVWILISFCLIKSFRRIFDKNEVLLVFISYTNYFVFFNYVLNTMRQGLAISIILILISYVIFNPKNKTSIFVLSIIAPLFHLSALIPVVLILLYTLIKPKLKLVFWVWILSIILSLTSLNKTVFSNVKLDMLNTYSSLESIERYGEVNRIDFILFSITFGIAFYIFAKKSNGTDQKIEQLTSIYFLLNSYFLLLGFVAYSDRIAAFSWFIIPLIVWKIVFSTQKVSFTFLTMLIFIILGIVTKSYSIFI